jgi:hypothetical protein
MGAFGAIGRPGQECASISSPQRSSGDRRPDRASGATLSGRSQILRSDGVKLRWLRIGSPSHSHRVLYRPPQQQRNSLLGPPGVELPPEPALM